MLCDDFRQRARDAGVDWAAWTRHLNECGDWYQGQQVLARGEDPLRFPCVHVAYRVTHTCTQHDDPWSCPDVLLVYNAKFGEYGLPVRDGGPSMVTITFCPWCGVKLPASTRRG